MIPDYKSPFYEFNVEGTLSDSQKLITPHLFLLGDTLSWNEVPGATSYELYLNNVTSYNSNVGVNLKDLIANQKNYNFTLKALSENSESELSNTIQYIFSQQEKQSKTVIPTKELQDVKADAGYILESVTVQPIPEEYIIPNGNIEITTTDEYDVTNYATAKIKDDNLKPENIAEGVKVLDIEGTFRGGIDTSDGTATSDDILFGKTAYVNEQKVVGNIETWDGTIDGDYKLYNALNDYLTGNKTKITKEDLEGLTELRPYAFMYSPITEVEFPSSVTKLRDRVFMNTSLASVNLEGITEIGQYTFCYAPIKELVLPSSITRYGQRCFEHCDKLEKVTIESQTGLSPHMFQYDYALKRVICLLETPPNIYADQFKQFTGGETIEVLPDKVETYKSATNWSNYADYIVAYEGD